MTEPTLSDIAQLIVGVTTRLDGIDNRLDGMDVRFDEMDARFTNMSHVFTRRINSVEGKLDAVLDAVSDRWEDHEIRISRLERGSTSA